MGISWVSGMQPRSRSSAGPTLGPLGCSPRSASQIITPRHDTRRIPSVDQAQVPRVLDVVPGDLPSCQLHLELRVVITLILALFLVFLGRLRHIVSHVGELPAGDVVSLEQNSVFGCRNVAGDGVGIDLVVWIGRVSLSTRSPEVVAIGREVFLLARGVPMVSGERWGVG
jgi:hypothetical protein